MLTDLILGTAGHIDHGKSSLIRALTGTDTARLPEEKKRGITIELGYAFLELPPFRLGIVDVPGHEKFVRQMLSGATGMDLALLVVAADDSIKQQTREHFDILRMLDLPAGVIALTKIDLVEEEWLELVEEEIRTLVEGSFLGKSAIVRVSSRNGTGLEDLRVALHDAAVIAASSSRQLRLQAPFRMAIDRCFPVEGYGTVVTGSVGSGSLRVGDPVEIQPQGIPARVRGLQNHESQAESVHRGQRAAVNLGGIHHEDVKRGDELAEPGHLRPARRFFVEMFLLPGADRLIKDRDRVRVHLGTSELLATVRILGDEPLLPGSTGVATLVFSEPAVATWGQPFVIRQESPLTTLGGGRVLHPDAPSIRNPTSEDVRQVHRMASHDPLVRAEAAVWFSDPEQWAHADLARTSGVVETGAAWQELVGRGVLREIRLSASRNAFLHVGRLAGIEAAIRRALERLHARNPLRLGHPLAALTASVQHVAAPGILQLAVRDLVTRRVLNLRGDQISLEGFGPKLTRNERLQLEETLEQVRAAGLTGPTLEELRSAATRSRDSVRQLVEIAGGSGELVLLGDGIVLHPETVELLVTRLRETYAPPARFTVSDLRTLLNISRKYAVPLCEWLDAVGITVRDGDYRKLVPVGPAVQVADSPAP